MLEGKPIPAMSPSVPCISKAKLGVTDRELVDQIAENPYMQYFIGYKEYRNERPFDPSLLVSFRKRLPESAMSEILERTFIAHCGVKDTQEGVPENAGAPENDIDNGNGNDGNDSDSNAGTGSVSDSHEASEGSDEEANPANKGTLIIDATCAPADIAYPTDLDLCDKATIPARMHRQEPRLYQRIRKSSRSHGS